MDDKVGGLEVKYVFNREETRKNSPFHESILYSLKDDTEGEHQNKDAQSLLERNKNFKESDKVHDRSLKKIKSDDRCVEPGAARGFDNMTNMPSLKPMDEKGEKKVGTGLVEKVEIKNRNTTPTGSDKLLDQPLMKFQSDKKPPEGKHVELEVACDSKRFTKMSSKKSMVDSKSKHEDKSPADANNLKASGTSGTTENRKKRKISANEASNDLEGLKRTRDYGSSTVPDSKNNNKEAKEGQSGIALDIRGNNKNNNYNKEAKEGQSGESYKELSTTKSLNTNKVKQNVHREFVVSPKPNAEKKLWFRRTTWEEDMLIKAYNTGAAILLHNVDPDYTSEEVEDIIWHAFNVDCDAKILQRTSVSSPHYAQAIIVLKTKEAAQRVLTKLEEEFLMISDGRISFMPLIGTPCPPISTIKNSSFFGHLAVGKARSRNQREDEAVSTSHFSQPNTIVYDMALEWRLLQLRSMKWWEKLHEQQGLEMENLKNGLKEDVHVDSVLSQ